MSALFSPLTLRSLTLQATGGKTRIRGIEVTFASGRTQRISSGFYQSQAMEWSRT